jgi:hypothetical protein
LTILLPDPEDPEGFQPLLAMCVVRVIRYLGKNYIETHRDISDVLRHIIKNVSERLVRNIAILGHVTQREFFEELKCAIEKLPFVTVLSPVRAVKGKGPGYGVTLRCPSCEEYGSCGKKQEPPVQVSSVHPTELACLQELLKRLQDRHVNCAETVAKKAAADAASAATVGPDAPNVLQAMMQLQQAKSRAEAANKLALEAEKERDAAEKAVEELKRLWHPKRPRTDDDAGDAHEVLAEVENWDLSDNRQQATRVQKPPQ